MSGEGLVEMLRRDADRTGDTDYADAADRIVRLEAEIAAWRKRFPMCWYEPAADNVFCESRPE